MNSHKEILGDLLKLATEDEIPEGFEENEVVTETKNDRKVDLEGLILNLGSILATLDKEAFVQWVEQRRFSSYDGVKEEISAAISDSNTNRIAYQALIRICASELAELFIGDANYLISPLTPNILSEFSIKIPKELFLYVPIGAVFKMCLIGLDPNPGFEYLRLSTNYTPGTKEIMISRIKKDLPFEKLMSYFKTEEVVRYGVQNAMAFYADPKSLNEIYGENTFENWIAVHKKLPAALCKYRDWQHVTDREGNHLC
jgi:hypothetical protein